MRRLVVFFLLLIAFAAVPMIGGQPSPDEATCSPWLGYCQVTSSCCRYLICHFYLAKCVPISGPIVPGQDTRPIGPGPYPPNQPKQPLQRDKESKNR